MNFNCKKCGAKYESRTILDVGLCQICFDQQEGVRTKSMQQQLEKDLYGKQEKLALQGWQCPVCEAVMAPFASSCVNCHGHNKQPGGIIPTPDSFKQDVYQEMQKGLGSPQYSQESNIKINRPL